MMCPDKWTDNMIIFLYSSIMIMTKTMLKEVIGNTDSGGLLINPLHKSEKGALVFLRRENIEVILKVAEKTISEQPEEIQRILRMEEV